MSIHSNFTAETCTGTGNVLTLLGALSGLLPFALSAADGEPVGYALVDSDGIKKFSGIGVYDSTANTITRKDNWNYDGAAVNSWPSSNLALSAGTHTIRSVPLAELSGNMSNISPGSGYNTAQMPDGILDLTDNFSPTADRLYLYVASVRGLTTIEKLGVEVAVAAATTNTRVGIYAINSDGSIGRAIADSGPIVTTSTGMAFNTLAEVLNLPEGRYVFAFLSDGAGASFGSFAAADRTADSQISSNQNMRRVYKYIGGVTGALPDSPNPGYYDLTSGSMGGVIWQ